MAKNKARPMLLLMLTMSLMHVGDKHNDGTPAATQCYNAYDLLTYYGRHETDVPTK
jgi:hypothetical protein